MTVNEVDPIHRRIVLSVHNIPADQPPKPEPKPEGAEPEVEAAVAEEADEE
jgi:hypothetical protein